jgi:HSP20 family molecular chaperone IbpA
MGTMTRLVPIRSTFSEISALQSRLDAVSHELARPASAAVGAEALTAGSFVRTFTLPQTVDKAALTASYDAGVLTITVAKKAEAKRAR